MIHALTAKNKLGFINGSIEPPLATTHPVEFALWNQCNSMILSWFAHSVEPDLAKGVAHARSAQQVWEDFRDQFSQKNAPAIYQILLSRHHDSFSLLHQTQRSLGRVRNLPKLSNLQPDESA